MAYPTSANLKTYLGISGSAEDTPLGYILSGVIARIERDTNRVWVGSSATRYFPVAKPYIVQRWRLFWYSDLAAISTLTNGDGVAISGSDYYLEQVEAPYHSLKLKPTSGVFWNAGDGGGRIAINGTWGYAATCPAQVFDLILRVCHSEYMARMQGGAGALTASRSSGLAAGGGDLPRDLQEQINMLTRTVAP